MNAAGCAASLSPAGNSDWGLVAEGWHRSPEIGAAGCWVRRKALGGGCLVVAASGEIGAITVSGYRAADDDAWAVRAAENDDTGVDHWSLQAFVICATAP